MRRLRVILVAGIGRSDFSISDLAALTCKREACMGEFLKPRVIGKAMQEILERTPISFKISPHLKALLKERAKAEGIGHTALVRKILIEKLSPEQQQPA